MYKTYSSKLEESVNLRDGVCRAADTDKFVTIRSCDMFNTPRYAVNVSPDIHAFRLIFGLIW